jgi:4a-hydroxytetrahydrobiopterin dehydratase
MHGMARSISPRQFHESAGVEDWRVVAEGVCAYFRTGPFAAGARLVSAISALPDLDDRHPDVDVRHDGVTVRLVTITQDDFGLSERDLELARQISAIAREQRVPADPSAVQTAFVTIDALDLPTVMAFWRAVLGYVDRNDSPEDLIDPRSRGLSLWFQQMDAPRPQRDRVHVDLWVAHDQAEARVAAAIAAGGRLVADRYAPAWWVLADPESNEACIGTWQARG